MMHGLVRSLLRVGVRYVSKVLSRRRLTGATMHYGRPSETSVDCLTPQECANFLCNSGYFQSD